MAKQFLQREERVALVNLVAGMYDFTDGGTRGRRVFIQETAGLGRFIPGLDLNGAPRTVASDLVGRLEKFGQLPDRPGYHSLGALLEAMLDVGEFGNEDAAAIASLIVRYSLIADPAYLKRLLGEHDIANIEVCEIPAGLAASPPSASGLAGEGPAFELAVHDERALETIITSEDNFLDIQQLIGAVYCAEAVCRIERPDGTPRGTGFLVGPDLLLTNQHVLKNEDHLQEAVVRFGYKLDAAGVAPAGKVFEIRPDFYKASPANQLDYALVKIVGAPLKDVAVEGEDKRKSIGELTKLGKHRGYLVLAPKTPLADDRVSIIQHPDGEPLKVVLTQNYVVMKTDARVQYIADTMDGSSGSPVFNHRWEVVALHHSGSPYPKEGIVAGAKKAWKGHFRVNEGIPMRAILEDFKKRRIDRYLPQD